MAEKSLSHTLMPILRKYGHASRIENAVGRGMPDVSFCIRGIEGFIENKWRDVAPRDNDTPVTLDHFSPQQRIWIGDRIRAGGRVWVLLYIERPTEYFLLRGAWAVERLGFAPLSELRAAAFAQWTEAGAFRREVVSAVISTGYREPKNYFGDPFTFVPSGH